MTFLYDIGNVIMNFDFAPAVAHYVQRSSHPVTDPLSEVAAIKDKLENGEMGSDEFIQHAIDTFGYQGTKEEFVTAWNGIFTKNEPMARVIEKLAADGHTLYLLSNTNGIHLDYLLSVDIFSHFQEGVYSHLAKCMKPGDQIYEIAIEQLSLDPAETIYIDDLPENAEAGRRFGFLTHQYDSANHNAFLSFLADHGVEWASRPPE